MNDGLLGPRLTLGHGAPMLKRGLAAGAVAFPYSATTMRKFLSRMIRPVVGGGGPTYLKQNLFHLKSIIGPVPTGAAIGGGVLRSG